MSRCNRPIYLGWQIHRQHHNISNSAMSIVYQRGHAAQCKLLPPQQQKNRVENFTCHFSRAGNIQFQAISYRSEALACSHTHAHAFEHIPRRIDIIIVNQREIRTFVVALMRHKAATIRPRSKSKLFLIVEERA